MKVLTLKQPYASLVASGIKEYEFRKWNTNYRGEFLIHAGKCKDKVAREKYKDYNLDYPEGCIICKVTLVDCVKVDDNIPISFIQGSSAFAQQSQSTLILHILFIYTIFPLK